MEDNNRKILEELEKLYPNAKPQLIFGSPFELLVAVILSAQCTDARVNQVTKVLFERANTPEAMAQMPLEELEKIIFPCGFYHNKARHLKETSAALCEKFNGEVPADWDLLQTLPGVGRKTANVVYAVAFGGDAIAVDTHVFRVSNRLGLATAKDVLGCEKQLQAVIPQKDWSRAHHWLIWHGRLVCKAQRPACDRCKLSPWCRYFKEKKAQGSSVCPTNAKRGSGYGS